MTGRQTQWLDYLHSPVIALAAKNVFCAAAMADGSSMYTLIQAASEYAPCMWTRYVAEYRMFALQNDVDHDPNGAYLIPGSSKRTSKGV
jgi:hypothetical protein